MAELCWYVTNKPSTNAVIQVLLQLLGLYDIYHKWACCVHWPFVSVGAAATLVDWEAAEDSALPKVSTILWPAHMALRVWKTAWGATFIFSRSTMILVGTRWNKWEREMNISPEIKLWLEITDAALISTVYDCYATNLNTSWSTLIPAACVNSYSSASSALRIFFFFMAYFWTILVTTSAGDPGAEAARCVGWDIADRIGLRE